MTTKLYTIEDIKAKFEEYANLINNSDRSINTKVTYLTHANRFIRWLAGEITL